MWLLFIWAYTSPIIFVDNLKTQAVCEKKFAKVYKRLKADASLEHVCVSDADENLKLFMHELKGH